MSSEEMYLLYHGLLLPREIHCVESLKFMDEFTFKDDNVVAATYPKSGTIWMQEILPLVLNSGDLTPIQTIPNWDRVPWLEENRLALVVDQLTSPRAMVTHFPYHLMPPSFHASKAKVMYVMMNPKDFMVSSYYFHQMAGFLKDPGNFDEFMDTFLEGKELSALKLHVCLSVLKRQLSRAADLGRRVQTCLDSAVEKKGKIKSHILSGIFHMGRHTYLFRKSTSERDFTDTEVKQMLPQMTYLLKCT